MVLALTFLHCCCHRLAVTYSSDSDPKNIKHVLWKNRLYGMKLDMANLVP